MTSPDAADRAETAGGLANSGDGEDVRVEDVLAGPAPAPVAGPRTRFNRKRDYAVIGLIVAALVAAGVYVWKTSELEATASTTSDTQYEPPADPEFFPPSLGEAWQAESGATWAPVLTGPTVVTGNGGEVLGRDPLTGDVRWSYRRDLPLCTVSGEWRLAIAVYRTSDNSLDSADPRSGGGCSEITSLKASTGKRDRQRNSDAELGTRLIGDSVYMTATGSRLLTTVRSDLVKTIDYGQLPAMVNPGKQPRTDCVYRSVTVSKDKVGVIERCPDDNSARLTVYKTTAKEDEGDKPVVVTSVLVGAENAQIVAMSGAITAVALADPGRLVVYNEDGSIQATHAIDLGPQDLRADPPGRVTPTREATGAFYWFTGSHTIVLGAADLAPMWTVRDTLGPGTAFAGRALIPVKDAISVVSVTDGSKVGAIPVDRGTYSGPVPMAAMGPMVFEQRGAMLVALR